MTADIDRINRLLLKAQDILEEAHDVATNDLTVGDIDEQIDMALREVEIAIAYSEEEMKERSLGEYGIGSTL